MNAGRRKRALAIIAVAMSVGTFAACSDSPEPVSTPSLPSPVQSAVSEAVTLMCSRLDDLQAILTDMETEPAPDPGEISSRLGEVSGNLQDAAQQLSADGEDTLASFATAAATAIDGLQAEIDARGSLSDELQAAVDAVQFALQQLPPGACG